MVHVVTDPEAFFVYFALPVACVAWFAAILAKARYILQLTLSLLLALVVYFFLHGRWPDLFSVNSPTMVLMVFAVAAGSLLCVRTAILLLLYVGCLVLTGLIVNHNSQLLASWLHAPEWVGYLLLAITALLLLFIVYKTHLIGTTGLLAKIVFTNLLVTLMWRVLWMEHPPAMDEHDFICTSTADETTYTDSNGDEVPIPSDRCPIDFSWVWLVVCVLTTSLQIILMFACRKRKPSKEKPKEKKKETTQAAASSSSSKKPSTKTYTPATQIDQPPPSPEEEREDGEIELLAAQGCFCCRERLRHQSFLSDVHRSPSPDELSLAVDDRYADY